MKTDTFWYHQVIAHQPYIPITTVQNGILKAYFNFKQSQTFHLWTPEYHLD